MKDTEGPARRRLGVGWRLHGDGRAPRPGAAVLPHERLSWPRTLGLGAQHVVAMFGATFVFPVVMGLDPNLAIMMSGVATVLFLLVVQGRVPSYLGTSASFVGGVAAIRAAGGSTAQVTGAIVVAGLVLAVVGLLVHRMGPGLVNRAFPPVVAGAVVLLIGLSLAPVVADIYWPQDQWTALATMSVVIAAGVLLSGFWSRLAVFVGLVFGYVLSWALDRVAGPITAPGPDGKVTTHARVQLDSVASADWFGLPTLHSPSFSVSAALLVLPGVIALIAENTGHVKAVGEMTGENLDPVLGRAVLGDGLATAVSAAVGGPPTTTYAENIGVMAATRVYSTAAYWAAAGAALAFGLCPKFGALVAATPGGVLGGITVVLYGMIGLLGAKIWIKARVDFSDPVNLVPIAAGSVLGIGGVTVTLGDFSVGGIALGTVVTLLGYHLLAAGRRWGAEVPEPTPQPATENRPEEPRPVAGNRPEEPRPVAGNRPKEPRPAPGNRPQEAQPTPGNRTTEPQPEPIAGNRPKDQRPAEPTAV
ncbi:uracil-xanthine permease [Streptomyces sp. Ag82_O1-12]|uniref:uracil-xanthine permease family protein n=1 Tax=unclassified Streptomyces TaxID=2593676 RepID=UPI000BD0AAA7|nr:MULTISPECIES: solute carrier family 23 protein [unclassified Streptomyces]SMQ18071.1 uracil-xanthine permease [Streptomyces sp. Ag82_O1-12]SOD47108.1 uracil-xanthine permease [Streptomyces sp. Ag82_G6-1]